MKLNITIPGEFPGMNEILKAANSSRYAYNEMKQEETDRVHWQVKQLPKVIHKPYQVTFIWIAKNQKRDPDNVAAAAKFILDGLTQAGAVPADTWKYVKGIYHDFDIDSKNPRIEITIEEVEGY